MDNLAKNSALSWLLLLLLPGCATLREWQERRADRDCQTYIVMPPAYSDEAASDFVAVEWIKRMATEFGDCDSFVDYYASKLIFDRFGFRYDGSHAVDDLRPEKLAELREYFGATQVVELRFATDERWVTIRAKTRALAPEGVARGGFRNLRLRIPEGENPFHLSTAANWLNYGVRFFPNSLVFGRVNFNLGNARNDNEPGGVDLVEKHSKSYLPPVMSGLGVTTIEHSAGFRRYDGTIRFSPSIKFNYWNDRYKFQVDCAGCRGGTEMVRYSLALAMVAPSYDAIFTAYCPVGAFYAGIGWGPLIYYYEDDFDGGNHGVRSMVKNSFGYRGFIYGDVYFTASLEFLRLNAPIVRNDYYMLTNLSYSLIGFGYYLPQMRRFVRDFY